MDAALSGLPRSAQHLDGPLGAPRTDEPVRTTVIGERDVDVLRQCGDQTRDERPPDPRIVAGKDDRKPRAAAFQDVDQRPQRTVTLATTGPAGRPCNGSSP